MSEKILTAFLGCSIASLLLGVWNAKWSFFESIISIFLDVLSIFKIFGITFIIIIIIAIGIALWEGVIEKSEIRKKATSLPENQNSSSNFSNQHRITLSSDQLQDKPYYKRSLVPIILVLVTLTLVTLSDASIYLSSTQNNSPVKPQVQSEEPSPWSKKNCTLINTSVMQFSSAVLTLATVIGFILFNKDEYHVWKARRRLIKHNRRRAREELNSINSHSN